MRFDLQLGHTELKVDYPSFLHAVALGVSIWLNGFTGWALLHFWLGPFYLIYALIWALRNFY